MSQSNFPIIVLHNVYSSKTVKDFVSIAMGMGFKNLVVTNAQGSAAQAGIPSAQKTALQKGVNFMVLGDVSDINELFQPDEILMVAPPPYGKDNIDNDTIEQLKDKRWVAVFGGNDPGLSKKDLSKGTKVVQVPAGDIGSTGMLTLGLALLTGKFGFLNR